MISLGKNDRFGYKWLPNPSFVPKPIIRTKPIICTHPIIHTQTCHLYPWTFYSYPNLSFIPKPSIWTKTYHQYPTYHSYPSYHSYPKLDPMKVNDPTPCAKFKIYTNINVYPLPQALAANHFETYAFYLNFTTGPVLDNLILSYI